MTLKGLAELQWKAGFEHYKLLIHPDVLSHFYLKIGNIDPMFHHDFMSLLESTK